MRYLEWLFPVMRYVRLRDEVSAWRAFATIVLAVMLATMVSIAVAYYFWTGTYRTAGGWDALTSERILRYLMSVTWRLPVNIVMYTSAVLGVLGLLELPLALLFVRKRPGRRRPLCTWQTIKYLMLAGQTWLIVALMTFAVVWVAGRLGIGSVLKGTGETIYLIGLIVLFVCVPFILIGSIAIQAALAVVALQDDRRCEGCGYFLIHLTVPRCPECGKPFDPAKLGRLSPAAASGQMPVGSA